MAQRKPGPASTSAWARVARSPRRAAAAAAAVGLGAIVVGAGIGFVVNGMRQPGNVGGAPSVTLAPIASPTESQEPSPSPSVSASASGSESSPTASPSPSESSSASTAPPSASPAPTTTPAPADDDNRLAGTWEPLPPVPITGRFVTGGAIRLADGRIAVLLSPDREGDGPCIWLYAPDTETWEAAAAEGEASWGGCGFVGSFERYVHGPDGRYYDSVSVIDTSTDPWQVTFAPWRDELAGESIAMTPGGRMYAVRSYCSRECRATVFEVDTETGEITQVAEAPKPGNEGETGVMTGPPSSALFSVGVVDDDSQESSSLLAYDPDEDEWTTYPTVPFVGQWGRARLTSDGWLWVKAFGTPTHELYARDPDTGKWLTVDVPPGVRSSWDPSFVDDADGRIYAMDERQPYVFTPEG